MYTMWFDNIRSQLPFMNYAHYLLHVIYVHIWMSVHTLSNDDLQLHVFSSKWQNLALCGWIKLHCIYTTLSLSIHVLLDIYDDSATYCEQLYNKQGWVFEYTKYIWIYLIDCTLPLLWMAYVKQVLQNDMNSKFLIESDLLLAHTDAGSILSE